MANALVTRLRRTIGRTGCPTRPDPEWLYCLTPKGEALSALCKMLA
jgi:DNA-binding HxlR family transcriptional regulator